MLWTLQGCGGVTTAIRISTLHAIVCWLGGGRPVIQKPDDCEQETKCAYFGEQMGPGSPASCSHVACAWDTNSITHSALIIYFNVVEAALQFCHSVCPPYFHFGQLHACEWNFGTVGM